MEDIYCLGRWVLWCIVLRRYPWVRIFLCAGRIWSGIAGRAMIDWVKNESLLAIPAYRWGCERKDNKVK